MLARAARLEPGSGPAHCGRAEALECLGRHKGALAAADRSARLDPREPAVHFVRGGALFGMGSVDESITALEEVARLAPDDGRIARTLHMVRRGTERA